MNIKQQEDEMLRSYITCFNKGALLNDEVDEKILVAAFMNRLRKGKFLFSLYKNDPKTISDVLYRATKYMNAKDALLAREEKPRKREKQEDVWQDRGQKIARTEERKEDRRSKPSMGKFKSFTSLTALIDQVLMQIKDEGVLTFLGKLKGDPNKRSKDKCYRFHRDHGHDTADCYDLKQQIEALIRQGKLQRFISKGRTRSIGDIRMIVGGTTAARSSKKLVRLTSEWSRTSS